MSTKKRVQGGRNVVPFVAGTQANVEKAKGKRVRPQRVDEKIKWPRTSTSGIPDGKAMDNVVWFCTEFCDPPIVVKFNEFDARTYILIDDGRGEIETVEAKELDDAAIRRVKFMMHEAGCIATTSTVDDGLRYLGDQQRVHPVRFYLDQLTWDGVPRLEKLLPYYMQAEDNTLNRAIGKAWMIAAVRRVRRPGCKVDGVLTLQGKQGTGKSSFFRILATPQGNNWFNDSLEMGSSPKEVIENATGSWIVELAEMSNKREAEEVKKFISIEADRARTAYARTAVQVKRQFVLGATVNREDFLFDDTGNRRFWVAKVGEGRLKELERDCDQLWAEAAQREADDEDHNIPRELWPEVERVAERYSVQDHVAEAAADALRKLPQQNVAIPASDLFVAIGLDDLTKRRGAPGRSVAAGVSSMGWQGLRKRLPGFGGDGSVRCYTTADATERPVVYRFKVDRWERSKEDWL